MSAEDLFRDLYEDAEAQLKYRLAVCHELRLKLILAEGQRKSLINLLRGAAGFLDELKMPSTAEFYHNALANMEAQYAKTYSEIIRDAPSGPTYETRSRPVSEVEAPVGPPEELSLSDTTAAVAGEWDFCKDAWVKP